MYNKIIIILFLICIIWFLNNKINKKENFNTEAINTLTSLYTDRTKVLHLNNLDLTGNLDVSGNSKIAGNSNITGNSKINGNLDISGNLNVTGNLNTTNIYKGIKARYLQLGNDIKVDIDKRDYWSISEIIVLDDTGTNVALNKIPTILKGTALDTTQFPLDAATDGVIYTSFYHGSTGENLIEIDLGQEYNLRQINLWARGGTNSLINTNRLDGTHVTFLNNSKTPIYTIHTGSWENTYNKVYLL